MRYLKKSARLAMQDGNEDARDGFSTRNLRNENVRRCLFPDDDDENGRPEEKLGLDENQTNLFFEEARNNLQKAKERWNFDFENETPLPGNYDWVKLDKDGREVPNSCVQRENQSANVGMKRNIEDTAKNSENDENVQVPSPNDNSEN